MQRKFSSTRSKNQKSKLPFTSIRTFQNMREGPQKKVRKREGKIERGKERREERKKESKNEQKKNLTRR